MGCKSAPPPPKPVPPPAPWKAPASRVESTAELAPVADQFDQQVAQLPGSDGTAHRIATVRVLQTLSRALQLVNGPNESPAFANRLGVVEASCATISDQTIPRGRMEAAENQALVAAVDALDEVSTKYLFDDDMLPALVKAAHEKVTAALASQGPMHDLDATAGFAAVQSLLREETNAFVERFGNADARTRLGQQPAVAAPTTPETPAATTAPAPATSAPATPPTTAPAP
jgi:hypothetical protein